MSKPSARKSHLEQVKQVLRALNRVREEKAKQQPPQPAEKKPVLH